MKILYPPIQILFQMGIRIQRKKNTLHLISPVAWLLKDWQGTIFLIILPETKKGI